MKQFKALSGFNKKIESFYNPVDELQEVDPKVEKARAEKMRKDVEKIQKYKCLQDEILNEESSNDEEDDYNLMKINQMNRKNQAEEFERMRSSSFDEMQKKKEKIFGHQFGALNKQDGFKITVPAPFGFENREKNRSQYIQEEQLEMYKREKELKEDLYRNYRFMASKVPEHVHKNLYEEMTKGAEEHKKFIKEHAEAMLRYSERPFSFEFRDKKKSKSANNANKKFEYKFKANPVPWYCQEQLLEKWNEEMEEKRHERMQKHAQELLNQQTGVHNRQAEYLRKMQEEPVKQKKLDKRVFSFKPEVNTKVPDFKKLQHQFKATLDAKRSKFVPTKSKGLSIKWQSTKKPKQAESLQQDLYYQAKERVKKRPKSAKQDDPIERAQRLINSKPKYQPGTTEKVKALAELRQRERELQMQQSQMMEKEEIYRAYKKALLAPRVQQSLAMQYSVDQQEFYKSKMLDTYKQQSNIIQKKWEDEMAEIMERVHNRPLLCEIVSNKFQENYYDMQEQYYQDQQQQNQGNYYDQNMQQEIKEVDQEAEQEMDTEQKEPDKSAKKVESRELLQEQGNELQQQYYDQNKGDQNRF